MAIILHLLIIFANCLDPDQTQHFVRPDLEPNYLTDGIPGRNSYLIHFEKSAEYK